MSLTIFFIDKITGLEEIWHPAEGITTVFKAGILAQVVLILKPELAPWQPRDAWSQVYSGQLEGTCEVLLILMSWHQQLLSQWDPTNTAG